MPERSLSVVKELKGVKLFRAIGRRLAAGSVSPPRRNSQDSESSDSGSSEGGTKNKQDKHNRILRKPVQYTYIRGISGLPTIRVPCKQCNCQPRPVPCKT